MANAERPSGNAFETAELPDSDGAPVVVPAAP
jgi:hypothetical protein